jgi:hypothetical protein
LSLTLLAERALCAEIGASVRGTVGVADFSGSPLSFAETDRFAESLFRFTVLEDLTQSLSLELHAVQSASAPMSQSESSEIADVSYPISTQSRYRALDLSWIQSSDADVTLYSWLDRVNLKLRLKKLDVTLGRQAVTFGQAYFWNPLDLFQAFNPQQFDRDYKAGVDAVRFDVILGAFSQLTLIGSPGSEVSPGVQTDPNSDFWHSSWNGSAALAHLRTTVRGWDLAIQAGKIHSAYQVGVGATGELGALETRLEAAYRWEDDPLPLLDSSAGFIVEDRLTLVVGIGRWLTPELNIEAEYLFNGGGAAEKSELPLTFARIAAGEIQQASRHLAGTVINYQLTPLIFGTFASVVSISDGSGFLQPNVTVSAASEVDIVLGVIVNWGERFELGDRGFRSEFGSSPDVYYGQCKVYF